MAIRFGLAVLIVVGAATASAECNEGLVTARVVQDIEYLRRAYARATDTIGKDTVADVEAGRGVYRQVFTADAQIGATGFEAAMRGPDAWVDVVQGALGPMGPTQHLIGSQIVTIDTLDIDDHCEVRGGSAKMDSYLQAWHTLPDGQIWLFFGNYADEVVYTPGTGWQIAVSFLERITEETRPSAASD